MSERFGKAAKLKHSSACCVGDVLRLTNLNVMLTGLKHGLRLAKLKHSMASCKSLVSTSLSHTHTLSLSLRDIVYVALRC
jgi:hypothetical protein